MRVTPDFRLPPSVKTFYPWTTTYATSRTTVATATRTKTKDPQVAPLATATVCTPESANKEEVTGLRPTHEQAITLCECLDPFFRSFMAGISWLNLLTYGSLRARRRYRDMCVCFVRISSASLQLAYRIYTLQSMSPSCEKLQSGPAWFNSAFRGYG